MVYNGWLALGGTEIANASRVEAYVRNIMPGFPLRGCQGCDSLVEALGDVAYNSPLQDDAPWIDSSNTASYDFLGFYPIAFEGVDSATTTGAVTQSIGSGGYNDIPRDATREIRVRGVLVATTHLGLEAGTTWLREALRPALCGDHGGACVGSTLCYYAACPELIVCYGDEPVIDPDQLYNITQSAGPTVMADTFGTDARIEGVIVPTPPSDGFTFEWGVSGLVGDPSNVTANPISQFGPVTPQRTNNVLNPRFAASTGLWTVTSGALSRVGAGAPDGGAYGHVVPSGTALLKASIATSPFGPNMLGFQLRTPAGAGMVTVNIRAAVDNSLVQTQVFSSTTDWSSYSLAVPYARDNIVEFESATTFDVTLVIAEGGTAQLPYFDGDTLPAMPLTGVSDAPSPEYAVSWTSAPYASTSRMAWLGEASFSFCGENQYAWLNPISGSGTVSVSFELFERVSAAAQAAKYERTMHDVVVISGPTVTQELATSIGVGRVVEFLISAANPYAYSTPTDLLLRYPLDGLPMQTWVDIAAPSEPVSVIVDPDCPPIPAPPRPPAIVNDCVDGPGVWDRYYFPISAEQVSAWSHTLPTVSFFSGVSDLRQVRARLTPNPFDYPVATSNQVNLSTNPSGEVATTGWARIAGTTGVAAVTNPTSTTAFGVKVLRTTWSVASTAAGGGMSGPDLLALAPGVTYSLGFGHIKSSITNRLQLVVDWYNGVSYISSTSDAAFVATAGTIYSKSVTGVAPALTTHAIVKVISVAGTSYANWSIASYLELDGMMTNVGASLLGYFDGDTADAAGWFYGWEGTSGLSVSLGQESVVDPYSYCGEFILSYLPADAELVVDGVLTRAWASVGGAASVPVSNLLYGTDGTPIIWPEMTCGIPYLFTVDVPVGTGDDILVSLSVTRRE